MMKKIIFIFMLLSFIVPAKVSYCQYLSEGEKEIYYEIMKLEYQLAKQNPDLMERGDYYYTDQMESNVHNVIARKYGITINQAWDIMERGLARKITPQEKDLAERVAAEMEYVYDDDSYTQEQIEELAERVARKYGTTFSVICELERRMLQQMGDWEEDWDDEWE